MDGEARSEAKPAERRRTLLDKVALFPTGPGVYTFLDARSAVIYVGKAKNLRSRVRSYLREDADDGRQWYQVLRAQLVDAACFETANEKEALLLENTLIKRHKPRWNIKLTDDKSFLKVELTTWKPWPQARLVRARPRNKPGPGGSANAGSGGKRGRIFGPFASARAVRDTLRTLKRWFPLRTCSDAELRQRTRPCIEHEMGRCGAPCVGKVTAEEYDKVVQEVIWFLEGKDETLLPRLRERMQEHSQALRYEQAARVRDQLAAIERTLEGQRMAREGARDQDVFGVASQEGLVVVLHLPVREGQVTEPRTFPLETPLGEVAALNAFLGQFYGPERYVPHEVLLPFDVEDRALLEQLLAERRGTAVQVKVEVRGDRRELLALATKNAALALRTGDQKRAATREVLAGLRDKLGLLRAPRTIECFDISTIQGSFTVASKVRFAEGDPEPSGWRTYRIRSVDGQDDFAAMEEVVLRRITSGLEDGDLPDLIVIDGGAPQLRRALDAAHKAGLDPTRTELVGLAKARALPLADDGAPGEVEPGEPLPEQAFERVHLPRGGAPVILEPASLECRFLARIRDHAHRAAIRFHRELRAKSALRSGLEEVPGVGPTRRKALLTRFGSLKRIREATVEELAELLPPKVAQQVWGFLRKDDGPVPVPDESDEAPGDGPVKDEEEPGTGTGTGT